MRWGRKAWQDETTRYYGHEDLVANLNADQPVSPSYVDSFAPIDSNFLCGVEAMSDINGSAVRTS